MTMNRPTSKVLIRNDSGYEETLWAFELGNDVYKLDNSPFFAYGVSYQDEILAKPRRPGEIPEMIRIHKKSGNRTIRIAGDKKTGRDRIGEKVLNDILALECSYEGASRRYVSVNIPPEADLEKVVDYLIEHNQFWEYADPTFEEVHKGRSAGTNRR
jgi:hypothetical protein